MYTILVVDSLSVAQYSPIFLENWELLYLSVAKILDIIFNDYD